MVDSAENKLISDNSVWEGFLNNVQHQASLNETVQEATRSAGEAIERTNSFLSPIIHQAANTLTQTSSSAVDQISQTTQTASQTLKATTNQAIESVIQTTNNATAEIVKTTEGVTNKLLEVSHEAMGRIDEITETASRAVSHVNAVSDRAVVRVTQTVETAKASLDETLQRAEQLNSSVTETVQRAIAISLQNWLEAHPLLAWLIAHPLLALVAILLLIWLFWGLLNTIASLTKQAWLALLRSPLKVCQWSVGQIATMIHRGSNSFLVTPSRSDEDDQKRLADILSRLKAINQEQEHLIKEMQALLPLAKVTNPTAKASLDQNKYSDRVHIQR